MIDDWRALLRRIEEGMQAVALVLGLVTFTFVAALLLAGKTRLPTGSLFLDLGSWTLGFCAVGWLIVFAASRLRAEQFGTTPPTDPPSRQDLLRYAVALLAGPMLLIWFVPRIAEIHPESRTQLVFELQARWVDFVLVGLGLVCIAYPIRAFMRYISRR